MRLSMLAAKLSRFTKRNRISAQRTAQSMSRRMRFEPLEDRRVLATFTVTNLDDAGDGSLRRAIQRANQTEGIDTVDFAANLSGGTISLTSGEIEISQVAFIDGTALAEKITIDASASDPTPNIDDGMGSRVFHITDGEGDNETFFVEINGVAIQGGDVTGDGGAILSEQVLRLNDVEVRDSHATGSGGGVRADKLVLVRDSIISGNSADTGGGFSSAFEYDAFDDRPDFPIRFYDSELSGNHATVSGGGLFARLASDFVFEDSVASNNRSDAAIGGISLRVYRATTRITDSIISGNEAGTNTGGLSFSNAYGDARIEGNTFEDNRALDGFAGGLQLSGRYSSVSVVDNLIAGNEASEDGGGVHVTTSIFAERNVIRGNTAGEDGGGVATGFVDRGLVNLFANTIADNTAGADGGGIRLGTFQGNIIVDSNTISDNQASGDGGGAWLNTYTTGINVLQTTISGNQADGNGGGVHSSLSSVGNLLPGRIEIRHSTITENVAGANTASPSGLTGGVHFVSPDNPSGRPQLEYNILANNFQGSAGTESAYDAAGSSAQTESNLFTMADDLVLPPDADTSDILGDPLLGPLQDNGGPTLTHAPMGGSPAIDAGPGVPPENVPEFDQRGANFGRFQNGFLDLGAFEIQGSNTAPVANAGANVSVRSTFTTKLNGSASTDPDAGPASLTYQWELVSGPGDAVLSAPDGVTTEFTAVTPGEYLVALTVSDGVAESTDSVRVTVTPNGIPVADTSLSETSATAGSVVILDGTRSSDPDGDDITYLWTLLEQPPASNVNVDDSTNPIASILPAVEGEYRVQLVVSDGISSSEPSVVTITVGTSGGFEEWSNPGQATDVDGNGVISPLDALLVINELTSREHSDPVTGSLNSATRPEDAGFLDVVADGVIAPLDALTVINALNNSANATVPPRESIFAELGVDRNDEHQTTHRSTLWIRIFGDIAE